MPSPALLNLGCGNRMHPDWVNLDFTSTRPGVIAHNLLEPLPFADNSFIAVYHSHVLEHFPRQTVPHFLRECFRILEPGGIVRVAVPDLELLTRLYLETLTASANGDQEALMRHEYIVINICDQMVRHKSGGAMLEYWKQNPMPAEEFVIALNGLEVLKTLVQLRSPNAPDIYRHPYDALTPQEYDAKEIGNFRLSGEPHLWMYDRVSLACLLAAAEFENIHICEAYESAIPNFASYCLDTTVSGEIYKPESLIMEGSKKYA
jgi:predicted SAM-dependent methyltransferase